MCRARTAVVLASIALTGTAVLSSVVFRYDVVRLTLLSTSSRNKLWLPAMYMGYDHKQTGVITRT